MTRALLVALLVVTAGCGGTDPSTPAPSASPTESETPTETATPTATPSPTAAPTATAVPESRQNPWREAVVNVHIEVSDETAFSERELVREALTYWSTNDTGYTLKFNIVDDEDAPITVEFVEAIPQCGYEPGDNFIGCADTLPSDGVYDEQTEVEIEAGYNRSSTVSTIKHEIGHTLGYTHDDTDRYSFMSAESAATPYRLPNATERSNPYQNDTITVYVGVPESQYYSEYEHQIERTLQYYESGADGYVSSDITFRTVDSEENATIRILFDALEDDGSAGDVYGYDLDQDPALETYTNATIRMQDIDEHHVGWHVGYWLAYAFGGESVDEYPEPFNDPESDEREDWWESSE